MKFIKCADRKRDKYYIWMFILAKGQVSYKTKIEPYYKYTTKIRTSAEADTLLISYAQGGEGCGVACRERPIQLINNFINRKHVYQSLIAPTLKYKICSESMDFS